MRMKVIVVEHSFTASLAGGSDAGEPLFSTKREGTGLGSAIAKRIAAAHDFGGHRVAAMRAVDAAIKQLQVTQQYDK
jgi:nitrogen fixation/metabolism regulation signal transduction histidine kinase